mgnify:CR=1 FL=1
MVDFKRDRAKRPNMTTVTRVMEITVELEVEVDVEMYKGFAGDREQPPEPASAEWTDYFADGTVIKDVVEAEIERQLNNDDFADAWPDPWEQYDN